MSRLFEENNVPLGEYYSEDQQETLIELADDLSGSRRRGYHALGAMRNALVHGTRPRHKETRVALKDPRMLRGELQAALSRFSG